jgi:hypothetical protein
MSPFFTGIMTPQPGDFACLPMGGTSGKLITLGEWLNGDGFSVYDHAEVYVGMPDENAKYGYTMGAYPEGAHLVPLPEKFSSTDGYLWSTGKLDISDAQRGLIVATAMACKGIPYSWLDYFALAAHRLHVPFPRAKEIITSSESMICSQLVDYCYMQAGVHLFRDGRLPGDVTPADLANLLERNA